MVTFGSGSDVSCCQVQDPAGQDKGTGTTSPRGGVFCDGDQTTPLPPQLRHASRIGAVVDGCTTPGRGAR